MEVHPVPFIDSSIRIQDRECTKGFADELVKGADILSPSEEVLTTEAFVTVTKGVAQRVQKIVSQNASAERRFSERLRNRPDNKRPYYGTSSNVDVNDKGSRRNTKLQRSKKVEDDAVEEAENCKICPVVEQSVEAVTDADATCPDSIVQSRDEKAERNDSSPADAVGKSAYARVKETLRIFNTHYLHFVQEEEKRCRKAEVDAKKIVRGSKSEIVQHDVSEEDTKRSSKRPDLKAISKMMETNAILYRGKKFGDLPGIDVGYQFFSRAEMVAIGFHSHWLNGIDYMGQSYGKLEEFKAFTFPVAVAIVLSGQYEDDLDNSEDVIYTGQGGNNLLGNKRQIQDQVMARGNLALKNSMEQSVPVRVIRGHESSNSYSGKVYTYDGLYKVVQYWAEKGVSGFTVFKYRLRRLEEQPVLTTNQVYFMRAQVPNSLSELRGLVCSDISGGLEDKPIPATNLVDDPPVAPVGLTYTTSLEFAESVKLPISAPGCNCKGACIDPKTCACARLNGSDFPYVQRNGGRLIEAKAVVFECGPNCGCGSGCINRTSQRTLKYRLEVFRTPNKGWAVRSWDSIPSGAPVCEYIGIVTRTDDLDSVCENNFIFDIDCLQTMKGLGGREKRLGDVSIPTNHLGTVDDNKLENGPEFCIDAGSVGNVARYINHSCEPNLFVQCVLSTHHDIKLARVVLFAADNIPPLQELTYDYGYAIDSVIGPDGNIKKMACYCGAADCRKRLY